jgi:glycosyltransferase involved in cell wall biosynthesis
MNYVLMKMNKTLIILAEYYPYAPGEFFLDDELEIISKQFERIIVFVNKKPDYKVDGRTIPKNLQVIPYKDTLVFRNIFLALVFLFSKLLYKESLIVKKQYKLKLNWQWLKIVYMELVRSINVENNLSKYFRKNNIDFTTTIIYSYWHDHKALALTLLKRKFPNAKCIARAHGWEVFADRYKYPYLPFKNYLIQKLDATVSISSIGKEELLRKTNKIFEEKIFVYRLGKTNFHKPNIIKSNKKIIICSCSFITPIKRIHLIIDILKHLKNDNVTWVHFGDGKLRNEVEQYAKQLTHINYIFMGIMSNQKILKFYKENFIDLFINVSESEGIPVSIMEAMSAAIPVVATNVGGISEIVNNSNGFLIDKDFDTKFVSEIISKYLDEGHETQRFYRNNAYNFWKKNYSAEKNYLDFSDFLLSFDFRKPQL